MDDINQKAPYGAEGEGGKAAGGCYQKEAALARQGARSKMLRQGTALEKNQLATALEFG